MWIFYRKHRAPNAAMVKRALVYSDIAVKPALAVAVNAVRRSGTPGTANRDWPIEAIAGRVRGAVHRSALQMGNPGMRVDHSQDYETRRSCGCGHRKRSIAYGLVTPTSSACVTST